MPIRPPNLDDRRYADLVEESRRLIPQYCPEWTNLGDADPGMTLVQLFAWMTELTIFRLNRVADKTYVHFLNFIGEERSAARPARAPVTFHARSEDPLEIPPFTKVSTRQREDRPSLEFLTVDGLTVHDSKITRVMAVRGSPRESERAVRELSFTEDEAGGAVMAFGGGRGSAFFSLDPGRDGLEAYTPHQYLYVGHDDFRLMSQDPAAGGATGRLRIRRTSDERSLLPFFDWEYPTAGGWQPIQVDEDDTRGDGLVTTFWKIRPLDRMGLTRDDFPIPEAVASEEWWIRGTLSYERWLAASMLGDLEIHWQDDRGGARRNLNNWEVRGRGRTLEFFLQDCPPIRDGWRLTLTLLDRGMPAGRNTYLPKYQWSYRRGENWEVIPADRVRMHGTEIEITGPLRDMATDGFNLRGERIETVFLRGLAPDLEFNVDWIRPVTMNMLVGENARRVEEMFPDEAPWSPFQLAPPLPPTIGRKWFIGSDLLDNRRKAPVLMELELAFEVNGEPVPEPDKKYMLQMSYRADDNWRVVYSKDKLFTGFTFSKFDPDGAKKGGRRRVRIVLDPAEQLKGLARYEIGGIETAWLRIELIKSNLSTREDKKGPIVPVVPRIYAVRLGADRTLGDGTYEHPIPNAKLAQVDHREHNRRLTRCVTRASGRLGETFPWFPWVDIEDEALSLYVHFDKPLPRGSRHVIQFRCRGEAYLPDGAGVDWEILESRRGGRTRWRRLNSGGDEDRVGSSFAFTRTGELAFALPDVPKQTKAGFWLRGRFSLPEGMTLAHLPAMPPVTHMLLNSVDAVNLHTVTDERFSGLGVPGQVVNLNKKPTFVHPRGSDKTIFPRPELFSDIKVMVEERDGKREEWTQPESGNWLTADKDDRLFLVDPVDGTLTFGNGIRGRMLPVGVHNVIVQTYRTVPGARGNVAPGDVAVCDRLGGLVKVSNPFPAVGGRDAETVEEILERAPSILTSRDRAVTRQDFEIIAAEASGEVARAACGGGMNEDGVVEVTILPHRREGERLPDPFLAAGLRDHVQSYLAQRCLINVEPKVKLANFQLVDVSVTLRLRPNANMLMVREAAERWVERFLDPYAGGLDGRGWDFAGTLYAQDFSRMIADIPEIRHVVNVRIYAIGGDPIAAEKAAPGWEAGEGDTEMALDGHDLFAMRRLRIISEEDA